jgi:hypothetical protein
MNDDARHRWQRRQIDAAIAKIEEFRDRCAPAAERYERLADLWGRLHVALGLPAAILAAVAGVAALADFSKTISGVVALCAAALSATTTFLGGADRQRGAKARADALRELATEADNYLSVDALDPYQKLDAPDLFKDFNERLAAVRAGQPLPEMWWRGRPVAPSSSDDVSWLVD